MPTPLENQIGDMRGLGSSELRCPQDLTMYDAGNCCDEPVSLIQTPSQLESMVQEARLLRKIVEGESDVCESDEGGCVCWGGVADLGRVIPR